MKIRVCVSVPMALLLCVFATINLAAQDVQFSGGKVAAAPSESRPPYGISGAVCWLNSDDLDVDDFGKVRSWKDATGNGNNFEQTTESRQPYLVRNFINGHAGLRFSGRQYLSVGGEQLAPGTGLFAEANKAFHVVVVGQRASKYGGSLFSKAAENAYYHRVLQMRVHKSALHCLIRGHINVLSNSPVGAHILEVGWDGTSATVGVDGTTKPAKVGTMDDYDVEVVLGARRSYAKPKAVGKQFNDFLDGYLFEVLVFDHRLTIEEQKTLSAALSQKYNLAKHSQQDIVERPNPTFGTLKLTVLGEDGKPTPAVVALNHQETGAPYYFGHYLLTPLKLLKVKAISGRNEFSAQRRWLNKIPRDMNGHLTVRLPAGAYELSIGKGGEFTPVSETAIIKAGRTSDMTIPLKRFINLPAMGWWSGDPHVHWRLKSERDNLSLFIAAMAADVHVPVLLIDGGNALSKWKLNYNNPFPSKTEYMSARGHEAGGTFMGHRSYLNVREHCGFTPQGDSGPSWRRELSLSDVNQNLKRQGGTFGYLHYNKPNNNLPGQPLSSQASEKYFPGKAFGKIQFHELYGMVVQVPEGTVDFVELLDNSQTFNPKGYFDYLNLGFRIAATAGTDFPFNRRIGEVRTFSYLGPGKSLSIAGWFDGIENGRTFITEGPLLLVSANGQPPGSVIQAKRGDRVTIQVDAYGYPTVGAPKKISLIRFGDVIGEEVSDDPDKFHLTQAFEVEVTRSGWYAVQLEAHNGARAFASPIYVELDGQPTWCLEKVESLTHLMLSRIEVLERALQGLSLPSKPGLETNYEGRLGLVRQYWTPKNVASFSRRVAKARTFYEDMAARARDLSD